jgi:glyoxylase-like metal-dependent hydrolase (beta-lactamase superfamily II)/rhodanese-related sulfurtransferase
MMFFRQVLNDDLGCASYVVADRGQAVVVDPQWGVEEYLELSRRHGFQITVIVETHAHADHVSGRARLAALTGASVAVPRGSEMEGADRLLADGDVIDVGDVRLTAIATPGHRPEHLSLLVRERVRDSFPALLLTGDSLLIGEVARPDLATAESDAAEDAARSLFSSLRCLLELDDFVEVWPGHVGGSLCGGGRLSPRSSSTLGYERRTNRMLAIESDDLFTRRLLASLPERPPHVARTVELNRRGLGSFEHGSPPSPLSAVRVRELLRHGATLIDGRDAEDFERAHIPRSLNVPSARAGFATRCARLADPDLDTMVLGRNDAEAVRMVALLEGVGFTCVRGIVQDGLAGWSRGGREFNTASTPAAGPSEVAALLAAGSATLLDVRDPD